MAEFVIPLHFEEFEREWAERIAAVEVSDAARVLAECEAERWWCALDVDRAVGLYGVGRLLHELGAAQRGALVGVVCRALQEAAAASSAQAIKLATFLSCGLVNAALEAESASHAARGRPAARSEELEAVLRALVSVVEEQGVWADGEVPEDFASALWRTSFRVIEHRAAAQRPASAAAVRRIVQEAVLRWGQSMAVTAALVHFVHNHEHAPASAAELLVHVDGAGDREGGGSFVEEALTELSSSARLYDLTGDANGARNIGLVLASLASQRPEVVLRFVDALVIPLLDEDSYQLRIGVVDALAVVVEHSGEDHPRRAELLGVVVGRLLDAHAFARSRAAQACGRLCRAEVLSVDELLVVAEAVLGRLADRAAAVRRSSLQMWRLSLEHNPFGPRLDRSAVEAAVEGAAAGGAPQQRLERGLAFVRLAERAVEQARALLRSQSVGDVVEAINLICCARQFGLAPAEAACRDMLPLLLARDRAVAEAACSAFESLLVPPPPPPSPKDDALALLRSLLGLIRGATTGEMVCVEALVKKLASTAGTRAAGILRSRAFAQVVWDAVVGKVGGAAALRAPSCALLGLLGDPGLAWDSDVSGDGPHVRSLASGKVAALTAAATDADDLALAREACSALARIVPRDESGSQGVAAELVDAGLLPSALASGVSNDLWLPYAEQALRAVYAVAGAPEAPVSRLVEAVAREALGGGREEVVVRLAFLVGQVAVAQLVFNELSAAGARPAAAAYSGQDGDGLEEALGGASAAADAEEAMERSEHELVGEGSLLGRFAPLMAKIACDPRASTTHRAAAASSLAKLMAVHRSVCEQYVRVLFSLLEADNAPPAIRANTVIAVGDLSFRYPNVLEPWSPRLYACTRDGSAAVRRNAVSALAHLILNDMVKVRGRIAELALALRDPDARVAELVRIFFHELHHKGANTIYNLLPATVSFLTQQAAPADRQAYREVMRFLVSFIDRGRHAEGMVDKLCPRFRATERPEDWRDIAFVLSLLPYQDRALRRLLDNFRAYADKLDDPEVRQHFEGIVGRARSMPRADRATVDELAAAIQRVCERGGAEELGDALRDISNGAEAGATPAPTKSGARSAAGTGGRGARTGTGTGTRRAARPRRAPGLAKVLELGSEE